MAEEKTGGGFYFVGNYLCLDFVNTEVVENGGQVDLLADFADLVAWSVEAEVVDAAQAEELKKAWDNGREAERVFGQARQFRTVLRRMAERLAGGKAVPPSAIERINELLAKQLGFAELVRVSGGFEQRFRRHFAEPLHLLVPVAQSAGDLLCHGDQSFVRKCENPACILYFYDTTKNHARRWCSMSVCGNRMKVAAHYQRRRKLEAS